jgi:hypothetical protein
MKGIHLIIIFLAAVSSPHTPPPPPENPDEFALKEELTRTTKDGELFIAHRLTSF